MLIVTLPWPDQRLTPNAKRRKHWRVYQPAIKADRETGWTLTWQAWRNAPAAMPDGPIPLAITFYPPDHRRRDDDGMIGAFKHMRDGIADALGVDDSRFRPVYQFGAPEKPGRVEVTIGVRENVLLAPLEVTG